RLGGWIRRNVVSEEPQMRFTVVVSMWTAALAGVAGAQQQGEDWVDQRFHRVYLTNGNVIDGQLIKETPQGATLTLKSGNITIRKDMIERIELIKMRSLNEKPPVLPKVAAASAEPPATLTDPKPEVVVDAETRDRKS